MPRRHRIALAAVALALAALPAAAEEPGPAPTSADKVNLLEDMGYHEVAVSPDKENLVRATDQQGSEVLVTFDPETHILDHIDYVHPSDD